MTYKVQLALEYLAKKYDETNIPLYLSYPTTSWWRSMTDEDQFKQCCEKRSRPFLYFHFPYCKKACYYCCCYKEITASEEKKQIYTAYLEKEFKRKLDMLQVDRFLQVRHLHWGGGTPTYMSSSRIERIFQALGNNIEIAGEGDTSISIEAYPDERMLSLEKLRLLRKLGFNEISLGIQDFDERVQKTINRDCTPQGVKKIMHWAKELGFRVHIDLCYGLPFQGINELTKTVEQVAALDAERVAVFPYAHFPLMFPLQRRIPSASIPNSFIKILLIMRAAEIFTSYGYKQVGIDHFVKPENPLYRASCSKKVIKDFMGYSVEQRRDFLGFGSSAISFIGGSYFHNSTRLKEYYRSLDDPGEGRLPLDYHMTHRLSPDDSIRDRIIRKSILCDFVIDKNELGREFGIDFDAYFKAELAQLEMYEADGLLRSVNGEKIIVTQLGKYLARHIAFVFDGYYRK